MTGLPLLRLPFLPLKDVFDEICIGDLISFHFCSRKTRELLKVLKKSVSFDSLSLDQKNELGALEKIRLLTLEIQNNSVGSLASFPKESITIKIIISGRLTIKIETNDSYANDYKVLFPLSINVLANRNKFVDTKSYFEVDGNIVPVVTDENEIFTFWDDQSHGFIYDSTTSYFPQNLEIAAKGMAQHTLTKCMVTGYIFNDPLNNLVLNSFKPTTPFEQVSPFDFPMNNLYGYNEIFGPMNALNFLVNDYYGCYEKFKSDHFVLEPANWFELDKLSSMDCKYIKLLKSGFTNNDMYGCMILWMDGKYPKLKRLTVQLVEPVNLHGFLFRYKFMDNRYTLVLESDIIHIKQGIITFATISKIDSPPENVFEMNIL